MLAALVRRHVVEVLGYTVLTKLHTTQIQVQVAHDRRAAAIVQAREAIATPIERTTEQLEELQGRLAASLERAAENELLRIKVADLEQALKEERLGITSSELTAVADALKRNEPLRFTTGSVAQVVGRNIGWYKTRIANLEEINAKLREELDECRG